MEHDERYRRAREFYDVVTGLWDSWADDAFIRDVESGIFFDPDKMHMLNHKGKYFSVKGPLNIARPVQGWPVIVQAGASDVGRQLAAETAEMVFTALPNMKAGQAFCADVKGRMQKAGRNPEHMTIMPACFVMLGETKEEAQKKRDLLDSKVNYANAIASLSIALGHDASKFDPDKPLPDDIPESNASKSGRERAIALGKRENFTVRQLAQRLGGFGGLAMVGTVKTVADEMEEWLTTKASDGFTIQFPYLPGSLDEFCDQLVPELQRRGTVPQGIRGQDAAREPRLAAAGQSFLRAQAGGGRVGMSEIENFHAHVYYDAPKTRAQAVKLCEAAGEKVRRQGRAHARQPGRPASARKLPAHHRQGPVRSGGVVAGAEPQRPDRLHPRADRQRAEGPHRSCDLARAVRDAEARSVPLATRGPQRPPGQI